ncbi:MAG TPA: fibronectin type III domain-containing protein [Prolixibacteraceae bacterium]|nr:fibronectin type III domain-containing protein [Prolixibacteraceae bacterium]
MKQFLNRYSCFRSFGRILFLKAGGICLIVFFSTAIAKADKTERLNKKANKASVEFAKKVSKGTPYKFTIDTLIVDRPMKKVRLTMGESFAYIPFRVEQVPRYNHWYKELLGRRFRNYTVSIESMGKEIHELIPNIYRDESVPLDLTRLSKPMQFKQPIVRNLSKAPSYRGGLSNRNIALWHSHGWYYENTQDRWKWQRPRLFTTVEDIWSMSFVVPYIAPMLENAGAYCFLPRERDTQPHEIIIDAEGSTKGSVYLEKGNGFQDEEGVGYALKVPFLVEGENPFQMGKSRRMPVSEDTYSTIRYIPDIPGEGEYAVYISYKNHEDNITDAHYTVHHSGGKTSFLVNQTMGGGTWIYLGTFRFDNGYDSEKAMIEVTNQSDETGRWVSADAVKLGGGMGNVIRGKDGHISKLLPIRAQQGFDMDSTLWMPFASQRPRYQEGARYYLQYAGMPDSLVYSINEKKSDYKDDYQSRGEWVNYLMGAPNGPTAFPLAKGLNIPIDMILAFHTDAGITPDSAIIGSLLIYNTTFAPDSFPNGQSKWASRDLADILQTQIVNDIQKLYEPEWTRRGLWNKQYSEAVRPKVPSVLTEILSHQNFADMLQANDPRFKFDVGRAFYKGILKFLSFQNGQGYVIQPLPVSHFQISLEGKGLRLSWKPVNDPLEPSAVAQKYKVYTRIEKGGFDNGQVVNEAALLLSNLTPGVIYSFKVTAINDGGESFPSEILACSLPTDDKKPVLIVNAFDRICGPEAFDNGKHAGFLSAEDEGVAYKNNLFVVGDQYDFDRKSLWKDDDAPGFGGSHADQEIHIVQGNTFDYPLVHGQSFRNNGYGFISMSDESFEQNEWNKHSFSVLDIIFGEEKTTRRLYGLRKTDFTLFTPQMRKAIAEYVSVDDSKVLLSGAYIGTDLDLCGDTLARAFAADVLHYRFITNHASRSGKVYPVNSVKDAFPNEFSFIQGYHQTIYKVESPDAVEPKGNNAKVFFRYDEDNKTAGVGYDGIYRTMILGFPFEALSTDDERDEMMGQILKYWKMK